MNVSGGLRRGVGVRPGIAPLPNHNNTETPASTITNGIQRSETTSGTNGLTHRFYIYGVVPITMAPYDGSYPKTNLQYYAYLVGLDKTSPAASIDACLGATLSSSVNKQSSTIAAGLAQSSYRQETPLVRLHKTELLNLPLTATPTASDMQTILAQVSGRYWMPWAQISVSGKRVPYQWMFADTTTTPDATTAPSLNLWSKQVSVGSNPTVLGGSPSEIITREFTDNDQRLLSVYCLDDDGYGLDISYTKQITQANTAAVTAYGSGNNYSGLTGATKGGASTSYASVQAALVNDPGSYTNTRHDSVLLAGETPIAVVYQDWLQAVKGMMPRWVDLSNPGCCPRSGFSLRGLDYLVQTTPSGLSPNSPALSTFIALTDDTGFLRTGFVYDVGFSFYNKLLDYETNVVYADSVSQSVVDNYGVIVGYSTTATNNIFEEMIVNGTEMPWEYSDSTAKSNGDVGRGKHLNDYEIRFYYRVSGVGEWLPAGSYDASRFWFYASWSGASAGGAPLYGPTICTSAQGGTVGGQANGFNDYSPLPKQRYICVQNFQNRAFWWSDKSMHFSLLNNIYAYPLRNIVACPTGKWRGGIVHNRNGVVQQVSRLVVFGDVAYSARFTGERTVANVRVSAETVGQFEIDGSDFRMDFLCEATAFSYRAACVADGILYWWGPQGVYRDDGVSEPKKISGILEPNIFDYVDMGRDSEVHSVYSKRTREVIWFYPPKTADAEFPTYGLAYNIDNGNFYPYEFYSQVDASQNLKIENDSTNSGLEGERVLLHCRETSASVTQRTYFFDEIVKAGEQGPGRQLSVISVSTPVTGSRRFTLAAGSASISSVAEGDYICVQNYAGYTNASSGTDMIAKVTAANAATPSIDVELPTGASWSGSFSLTSQTAFPIYHKKPAAIGINGISYNVQTNYWLPAGVSESWIWQYLYLLFKYTGIPAPTDPFSGLSAVARIALAYRTLVCDGVSTDTLTLVNNSAGHCQIHHPLRNEARSANGQALAYSLSGIHIGDPWTLEYLEAHCLPERGFTLKEFEG